MSTQGDALERDSAHTADDNATTLLEGASAAASDAAARLSDAAQAAGRQAKDVASGLATEANQNVKGLLSTQLTAGAELATHLAEATRAAADNLSSNAPQLAGVIRTAADTIDDFSSTVRGSSVDDVLRTASDFTRRQPAAVFGAAALAGFMLLRVLKAANPVTQAGGDRHGA